MSNWIVFESIAVFVIWMQRKGRWAAFLNAASGQVTVGGSDRATDTPAYSEQSNSSQHPSLGGTILPGPGTTAAGVPGGQGLSSIGQPGNHAGQIVGGTDPQDNIHFNSGQ